mgnify:CR=1 FL=1
MNKKDKLPPQIRYGSNSVEQKSVHGESLELFVILSINNVTLNIIYKVVDIAGSERQNIDEWAPTEYGSNDLFNKNDLCKFRHYSCYEFCH